VYQTLPGNPRLRLAAADPSTPAERLRELPTPAQLHGRFRQLKTICARLGVPMTAVVVRLEALDRMREELGGGAALRSLVAAADRLATSTREGDELGRWSDDELGLLCPGATPEALRELTSALAATLEQVRVRHELQDGIQITLPLRVELSLVHDLGEEPQSEEDELPPPLRHLHVA